MCPFLLVENNHASILGFRITRNKFFNILYQIEPHYTIQFIVFLIPISNSIYGEPLYDCMLFIEFSLELTFHLLFHKLLNVKIQMYDYYNHTKSVLLHEKLMLNILCLAVLLCYGWYQLILNEFCLFKPTIFIYHLLILIIFSINNSQSSFLIRKHFQCCQFSQDTNQL